MVVETLTLSLCEKCNSCLVFLGGGVGEGVGLKVNTFAGHILLVKYSSGIMRFLSSKA